MAERRHLARIAELVALQRANAAGEPANEAKATEGAIALAEWQQLIFHILGLESSANS